MQRPLSEEIPSSVKILKEAFNNNKDIESQADKMRKPKSGADKKLKVKVKRKVTDIQTLKKFLNKAKIEAAARGGTKPQNKY